MFFLLCFSTCIACCSIARDGQVRQGQCEEIIVALPGPREIRQQHRSGVNYHDSYRDVVQLFVVCQAKMQVPVLLSLSRIRSLCQLLQDSKKLLRLADEQPIIRQCLCRAHRCPLRLRRTND